MLIDCDKVRQDDNTLKGFFELLKGGLWEDMVCLSSDGKDDWDAIYRLAQEQSVLGLVMAGLEHSDMKPPQTILLQWIGELRLVEQRNSSMNAFVAELIERLRDAGVYALLVKGQGVAQCYERPLWRLSGDVDLLLSQANYHKSIDCLSNVASSVDDEISYKLHKAMTISSWDVDLHGSLRSGLWEKLDRVIDEVQDEVFCAGAVRSWMNGHTQVFIPRADEDVVFVFAHILQHFYRGGIGVRQICDWCRLLWTYKDSINRGLLEKRIRKMGVMNEWKAFAMMAVKYLGMPIDAMPFYSPSGKWIRKAERLMDLILEMGNFGHSRIGYQQTRPVLLRKAITLWIFTKDNFRQLSISPINPFRVWYNLIRIKMFRRYGNPLNNASNSK